jgi:methyl-accepting chemotaxis protein
LTAAFAAHLIGGLKQELGRIASVTLPNTVVAGKYTASLLETARHTRGMLIVDEPAQIQEEIEATKKTIQERTGYFTFLDQGIKSPSARAQFEQVKAARSAYMPLEQPYLELVARGDRVQAKTLLLDRMRPAQVAYVTQLEKLVEVQSRVASDAAANTIADAEGGLLWLGGAGVLALLMLIAIAWLSTRSIVRPLARAVAVSDEIAKGNLRNDVHVDRNDELGALLRSLAGMQTNLAGLVGTIQGSARDLTSASAELATSAEQVSAASNNQSEAAAAMAASVEEMTVSVGSIAESAQLASQKTTLSNQLSNSGRQAVENAGNEMTGIADGIRRSSELVAVLQTQSREISSIADVIKNIAEQTNLLALNAAIEAARAGEEGRGFAVVADAVRALAERTTNSTAQIAETIQKVQASTDQVFNEMNLSVMRATTGLDLSQDAGRTMNSLSSSADEVLVAVKEISSALSEQSQAANDIARHVESIAQMAQENTGAVDQTKESARTLQQLATELHNAVMCFTI